MKMIFLSGCFVLSSTLLFGQYKHDNVLYKTVYTQDLCETLNKHPNALMLDVRSPGEYMDTSSRGMNLGRFKNAVNVEARELGKRIGELSMYKDRPVFVYCSHSQRSRRASRMLADSGFKQVFNVNAGMTGLRQLSPGSYNCLYEKLETKNGYNIISAAELCKKLSSPKDIFLLDVRPDSIFKGISPDARMNAYGHIRNTVHIPLANLEKEMAIIPQGKEIVITDIWGDEAARAAELLLKNRYTNVHVLLEGYDRWLNTDPAVLGCAPRQYVSNLPYKIINALQLKTIMDETKDIVFLDARTAEEFTNTHKNAWLNLGQLKNAINVPAAEIANQWAKIESYRSKPVIVYVYGSGKEAHETARKLVNKGFSNVMVLHGGIFNVGWTGANIKGYGSLSGLRVNLPAEN